MERTFSIIAACSILLTLMLNGLLLTAEEEVINRIVVVVDDSIITHYDLQKAALWNREDYDLLPRERKIEITGQQINRLLVLQEINKTGNISLNKKDVEVSMESLKRKNPDPVFTESDIEEYVKLQLLISAFARQRFAPLVRINDEDIREFYQNEFIDSFRAQGSEPPHLMNAWEKIKTILENRKINSLLKEWLDKQKEIHKIIIIEPL